MIKKEHLDGQPPSVFILCYGGVSHIRFIDMLSGTNSSKHWSISSVAL